MQNKNIRRSITCIISIFFLIIAASCKNNREVTVHELRDHIKYLASDSLKGRLTGTPGDSLAADYIRNELASYGFQPLSGDGFQRFKVTTKLIAGPENNLSVGESQFTAGKDFMPLAFSSSSGLISQVIFAGYGFNIDLDTLKWNDYQGIDVKGKWVLVLRADPETDKQASPFIPFSSDRGKAITAKDMGAAGILLVSGPLFDDSDTLEPLNSDDFSTDIPAIRIKRQVADLILSGSGLTVAQLEKKLIESRKPSGFVTKATVSAKAEIIREMNNTRNVVMVLPGEDPDLKNEYVIIGAHFDHLGMGGTGSSSMAGDTVAVHHGADDNASGVAMMLELAEKYAHTPGSHRRSVICIAFTGEEKGMVGSRFFVENPEADLSKVNVMINLDMVGRLQDTKTIQVQGVGTAEGLRELILSHTDTSELKLTLIDEGYGPSDFSSFYGKNIPVLFYSTGVHIEYHTPADTWDKINYPGMVSLSEPLFNIAERLATSPERLKFTESGPSGQQGRPTMRRVITLGITPDVAGIVKNGLMAIAVTPGRPAAIGGMKKGDIITAIDGKSVKDIQEYMFRLGQLKRGQTISVEVLRDNKKLVLLIQL